MTEAFAQMWWVPFAIVFGIGAVIVYVEYKEWRRRESWFTADTSVLRPRAYRDLRGPTPSPDDNISYLLKRQAE